MTEREPAQTEDKWYSILPDEGLPEYVDSWMVEIPSIGRLSVELENKPGLSGFEEDGRVFVLDPENKGIAVNGTLLFERGYKTLNFSLMPEMKIDTVLAFLGIKGKGASYESVLQTSPNKETSLVPLTYWEEFQGESEGNTDLRDIMITKDLLKDIQLQFLTEGGEQLA